MWSAVCGQNDMKKIFSRENIFALLFCLILIALTIFTADSNPTWIYQGF
jgi:hypothetical protein